MENNRDIVLFLGAGFSCELGLPTMNNFGHASEIESDLLKNEIKKKPYIENVYDAGLIFQKFQRFCENSGRFININSNNMEEIFCTAEIFKQINHENILGLKPIDLVNKIKLWLWKIYQQFPPLSSKANNIGIKYTKIYDNYYVPFITYLKQFSPRLSIITTNYDLVFEYLSWSNGIKSCYTFDDQHVKEIPGLDRNDIKNFVHPSLKENCPVICKLHGGINYFQVEGENNSNIVKISIDIANDRKNNKKKDPRMPPSPCLSRPSIFRLVGVNEIERINKNKIVPALIPPTYEKLQNNFWLRDIWKFSLESIKQAKIIIFIGYSLPDTDGFLPAMMRAAMTKRKTNSLLNIYVIDPSLDVHIRYSKLFKPIEPKKTHIKYIVKPFTKAISDIKNMIET